MKKRNFDYRENGNKIELWTGLKDKHGQKIFEGDRIRFFNDKELTYEVKFYDFGFRLWRKRVGEISSLKYVRQIKEDVEIIKK